MQSALSSYELHPAYADVGPMVREAPQTLVSELIESRYGRRIARIRQDIRASTVPANLAEELKVESGFGALVIVCRHLHAADDVFEITVTTHPAERFTFSMELNRSRD